MPIFDYECQKCGAVQEIRVPRYDSTPQCPKCGSDEMKKLPALFSAMTAPASNGCPNQSACAEANGGGHHCCGGCCHH